MIQNNFSDISTNLIFNDKNEELAAKLHQVSRMYNSIVISITDFNKILGVNYRFFISNGIDAQPITLRDVLATGLYYFINGMKIYVTKDLQEDQYQIREE
jgi:hypothetical protein